MRFVCGVHVTIVCAATGAYVLTTECVLFFQLIHVMLLHECVYRSVSGTGTTCTASAGVKKWFPW